MSKLSKTDLEAIRDTIKHTGEFRVHLIYARSGLCTKARMWHPDGHVVGRANGGGYDKGGAALGQAIELFFAEELKGLPLPTRNKSGSTSGLYCLYERKDGTRYMYGACGKECMLAILKALGYEVNLYETGKLSSMVVARKAGGSARPALLERVKFATQTLPGSGMASRLAAIRNGREG